MDTLSILDHEAVIKLGWTGEALLQRLIDLDYQTLPDLNLQREGSIEQWAPVFMKNPHTWALLVSDDEPVTLDSIVGYWSFFPLFDPEYARARSGTLDDSDITPDRVRMIGFPGEYRCYFVMLCILPAFQKRSAIKLIRSIFTELLWLAREGVFIREFCANAFSDVGRNLCKGLEMEFITKHHDHGDVFAKELFPYPHSTVLAELPELAALYRDYDHKVRGIKLSSDDISPDPNMGMTD